MRLPILRTITDVVETQMCCGCGACASIRPDRYEMVDTLDHGRRPRLRPGGRHDDSTDEAMDVCPGRGLEHDPSARPTGAIAALAPAWGPVLEVWEGHAGDASVRNTGSSGGVATAIAIACVERLGMHGALHVRARPDAPLLNETVLSRTRDEILAGAGSRYAPASPCDGLALVETAPDPCVFIGKPCDVAAVDRARRIRPRLERNVGVTIAIFCAGTPTTAATHALLDRLGIDDPHDVAAVRYRGRGWPGRITVTVRTGTGTETRSLSYEQGWGEVLARHKQWRCHVCADHTGEFADLAVGDAWHRRRGPDEPGRSLVLVRTARGREIVRAAMAGGDVVLERANASVLPRAQPDLLRVRGALWGRLLALRALGIAVPRYRGFPTFRFWCGALPWRERVRSILGTARRAGVRRLRKRAVVEPMPPPSSSSSPVAVLGREAHDRRAA